MTAVSPTADRDRIGRCNGREDIAFATIGELRGLLDRRSVSAVELARIFLDRLATIGPRYNALAAVMPDRALAEARAADRRMASGSPASPLDGMPYGAKDLLAARGAPTTFSSGAYADQVLDFDAAAIERLRRRARCSLPSSR